ncbi:MAG TPA: SBBP repeat-containing protein [bacterium]|jgi:hypothetical protein
MSRIQTLLLVAVLLLSGCTGSGGSDPISADEDNVNPPVREQAQNPGNRYLLGMWNVKISTGNGTAELVPIRTGNFHFNAIKFLEQDPCTTCLGIDHVEMHTPTELWADINVHHPYAPSLYYCLFDVRGICMMNGSYQFPASGTLATWNDDEIKVANPDGYSTLFNPMTFPPNESIPILGYIKGNVANDLSQPATINPFLAFGKNLKRRLFGVAETNVSRTINIFVPPDAPTIEFAYALDASWLQLPYVEIPWYDYPPEANCLEAYEIGVELLDSVDPIAGGTGEIRVTVKDHQGPNTIVAATMEGPDFFPGEEGLEFEGLNQDGDASYRGVITNVYGADMGDYPLLIRVRDWESDENLGSVSAYWIENVHVDKGWAHTVGSLNDDTGNAVVTDSESNIYMAGNFSGSVQFDPLGGDVKNATNGSFVTKYNWNGAYTGVRVWAVEPGTSATAEGLAVDSQDNIYACGKFSGTVDFDAGPAQEKVSGNDDAYLLKYSREGDFLWVRTWGAYNEDCALNVTVDVNDNVFVTGYFSDDVDFDPGFGTDKHYAALGKDAYVSKFNSNGDYLWARTWGGPGDIDQGEGVAVDPSGSVYVTGAFQFKVDFDPGATAEFRTSNGDLDCFLSKFSAYGAFLWVDAWGGIDDDISHAAEVPAGGLIVVGGEFRGAVDFDPGPGTDIKDPPGDLCSFVSIIASSGTLIEANAWGAVPAPPPRSCEPVKGMAFDQFGNLYVTGFFQGEVDFDPDGSSDVHTSNGDWDAFISKFNVYGEHQWTYTWGGGFDDRGFDITVNDLGRIFVAGMFSESVDFDPGPGDEWHQSNGKSDAFVVKYTSNGLW